MPEFNSTTGSTTISVDTGPSAVRILIPTRTPGQRVSYFDSDTARAMGEALIEAADSLLPKVYDGGFKEGDPVVLKNDNDEFEALGYVDSSIGWFQHPALVPIRITSATDAWPSGGYFARRLVRIPS